LAETPLERGAAPRLSGLERVRAFALAWAWLAALLAILALGAALRFHGLDWDQPAGAPAPLQMHPDERFLSLVSDRLDWPDGVGGYFDTAKSPLNPYNDGETNSYVYGTFPLFLVKGVATAAGDDPSGVHNSYDTTVIWGRRVTAGFDTATILLVFLLGASVFSRRIGLLGALLYALAVLPTQLAHFWTMDPYLTFFAALTVLLSARWIRSQGAAAWVCAAGFGLSLGLAGACKVNGAVFAVAPIVALAIRIALRDQPRLGLLYRGRPLETGRRTVTWQWANDVSMLCLAAAISLLVFRIAQPYAFSGPSFWDMSFNQRWWDDIQRERDFQQGNADYPPFVQFAGTTPFLTPLKNLVLWGLGPLFGITAFASLIAAGYVVFKRREVSLAVPLAFASAIFIFQGPRFVAFMRYFEPMYPVLALFAAWGLLELWKWRSSPPSILTRGIRLPKVRVRAPDSVVRWASAGAVVAVLAATVWWALAFQSVYSQEHPRIAASQWVYDNVPAGSRITGEIWDDTIPYGLPGEDKQYVIVDTTPYDTDSEQKVEKLVYGDPENKNATGLNSADYVAITSNRVRDSVKKLEGEYPATIRYYQLLDTGELGFERVATFKVHPTFLGISIDDSHAEESFTVYDHPEVRIYKKTSSWDPARAVALLDEAHPERAYNLLPRQGKTNGLQFTPEEAQTQQAGGTFTDVFDAHGWASHLPWLWWLVWLEVAAIATVPWVTWAFKALPARGYGLSKFLGLTTVALPTWLIVAWGAAHFSGALVWAVLGASVSLGLACAAIRRNDLVADVREHWPAWLAVDGVFLLAFFAFLLLRAFNPDLWYHPQGGEKPMEIAYLTAVTRSTIMPPYDPWFAGGSLNYYYMGWFFLAVPIRALKIVPEVAFNLGVPTYAAMAGSVAFTVVQSLVGLGAKARAAGRAVSRRPMLFAGLLGAILLIGIANLDGAHQWVERLQAVNTWDAASGIPVVGGAVGIVGGLWNWLAHGSALPPFDWWRSSRVHFGTFDITEFPYWSMLFADLHPHLMGLPFFGTVVALLIAYTATVRAGLRFQGWLIAGLIGLAVGLVRTVHTWDFPTVVLMTVIGMPLAQLLRTDARWQQKWWDGVGHLALAGLVAVVAFAPYTAHFETFDPGIKRAVATTKVHQFFVHFGVFIAFAVAFLAVRYREELESRRFDHGHNPFLAMVNGWMELGSLLIFLTGLVAATWPFGLTTIALGAVFEAFLLNLLWCEIRREDPDIARALGTSLFVLAFGVAVGVDLITLNNDIERMNTVFKFSLQAWQLFALASGYAAWYAGSALWAWHGWRPNPRKGRQLAAWSAALVIGGLMFGASLYLISGTRARQAARFNDSGPTLDGFAFLDGAVFVESVDNNPSADYPIHLEDDKPLIDWLRNNVQGSPVISEAVGPLYRWTGRMSEYTGLPAVIGWDWHQIQQRTDYQDLIQKRRFDTEQFYKVPDQTFATEYIEKYNVSYVIVGTEEIYHGTPEGIAKFAKMPQLEKVFESGQYAIYRVKPN
jgi:YYY domain-containing protein